MLVDARGLALRHPGPPPVNAVVDADVAVADGEYVAVTGRSGAGKSSLLALLGCLERPTAGSYKLAGIDVLGCGEAMRASIRGSLIGFVFQSFLLDDRLSASQNVALGLLYRHRTAGRTALCRSALERVRLGHRIGSLGGTLSGGERQRVAVARAIVHRPRLLLADEPTGSLDSETAEQVLDLFDELHRDGLAIVCVTHSAEVAARADRILVVDDGVIK